MIAEPALKRAAAQNLTENMAFRLSRRAIRWFREATHETEPKRIGLFGWFGSGNFGNNGSLESMLLFLRRAAAEQRLLCICGNPAKVTKTFRIDAIPICHNPRPSVGRWAVLVQKAVSRATLGLHIVRHLRRLKLLVVPGMGVLDDFEVGPLGWPHDILIWFLLARLMGVKVLLVSIGAGPIRHLVSRWLMKSAARAAHYRSYRDPVSKAFMESIGFDTRNDPIYPDIAFGLPAPASTRLHDGQDRPLTIGVGVMAYQGWRNAGTRGARIYAEYIEKMTGFVVWLLDRGHPVRILMGDEVDRRAVDDLVRAVRSSRPDRSEDSIAFAPAHTLRDVMQQMADTDLVVATRYRNVVCALRVGKPTMSIGYAKKNDALLAEFGLASYCQHVERLDVERLKAQTMQLISNRLAAEAGIAQALERFESRLREQEDLLLSLIRSGPARAHGAPLLDAQSPVA